MNAPEAAPADDRRFWFVLAAIVAAGGALRLLWPEVRPIHHDEAVNWFLARRVVERGAYLYDPTNYHGPTFHYVASLVQRAGGNTLFAHRLPTMLMGTFMVAMVGALRPVLGRARTLGVAVAIALSPSLVYFGRDAIHETWLAAATLGAFVSGCRWWRAADGRAAGWALASGACIGFAVATKETAVLTFAAWAAALVGCVAVAARRGGTPPTVHVGRDAVLALVAVLGVGVLFFSGFFLAPQGLANIASALWRWTARGVDGDGHGAPIYRIGEWLVSAEGAWLAVAALGAWRWRRTKDLLHAFTLLWCAALFVAYSAIPYKTPWCVIQISVPLAVAAGVTLADLWASRAGAVAALAMAVALTSAVALSFFRVDDPSSPLVYGETHREFRDAMDLLDAAEARVGRPFTMLRLSPLRWPLQWYARDRPLRGVDAGDPWPERVDADVVIVAPEQSIDFVDRMQEDYVVRSFKLKRAHAVEVYVAKRHAAQLPDSAAWRPVAPVPRRFEPPARPPRLAAGFRVQYFPGRAMSAAPSHTEIRALPVLKWSSDHEKPMWAPLHVRWEGWITVPRAGTYGFSLTSDDASRLWIDGELVVDAWGGHSKRTASGARTLDTAPHFLRIHWVDLGGGASLEARLTPPGEPEQAWPAGLVETYAP